MVRYYDKLCLSLFRLVNTSQGPTLELPLEQVQVAFDTNVFSVLRVNRAVLPHMAARKQGMFITIGSVVAQRYARPSPRIDITECEISRFLAPCRGVAYMLLPSQHYTLSPMH